jgi:predicted nucleotidyltransferase
LATLRLRDRDAIIAREGLIFRVFGYSHPSNAYICDAEYAPAEIFTSENRKAFRNDGKHVFYKFYEDDGWKFIKNNFPRYMIFHEMLGKNVVGIEVDDIVEVRKPNETLKKLVNKRTQDELRAALQNVLEFVTKHSGLSIANFGVFGSMLHGFYHPKFSDIDLIIYGGGNMVKLRETLLELYKDEHSPFRNEFENAKSIEGKHWKFKNYNPKEFVWHQQRKMIYALFNDEKSRRIIKTEFEPVKDWKEIEYENFSETVIVQKGWTKMFAHITEDKDAPFIPSFYHIEPIKILHGTKDAEEASRIVSYMEEFRLQAQKDEKVYVEGNLEEVTTRKGSFYQIALTYCPRYYEQGLKVTLA